MSEKHKHTVSAANSGDLYTVLEAHFGETVHSWPIPGRSRPGFFGRKQRQAEREINAALAAALMPPINEGFRRRWWEECDIGQIDEDAGGFLWRCWCRAMQQPNEFLTRYGRSAPPRDLSQGGQP